MSAVKKGHVSDSRLAILLKSAEETLEKRGPVTVDRSGGGVWAGGLGEQDAKKTTSCRMRRIWCDDLGCEVAGDGMSLGQVNDF